MSKSFLAIVLLASFAGQAFAQWGGGWTDPGSSSTSAASAPWYYQYTQTASASSKRNPLWMKVGGKKYKMYSFTEERTYLKTKVQGDTYTTVGEETLRVTAVFGVSKKLFSWICHWDLQWAFLGHPDMGSYQLPSGVVVNTPKGSFMIKSHGVGAGASFTVGAGYGIPISTGIGSGSIGVGGSVGFSGSSATLSAENGTIVGTWQPVCNNVNQVEHVYGDLFLGLYLPMGMSFSLKASGGFNHGPYVAGLQPWFIDLNGSASVFSYSYLW